MPTPPNDRPQSRPLSRSLAPRPILVSMPKPPLMLRQQKNCLANDTRLAPPSLMSRCFSPHSTPTPHLTRPRPPPVHQLHHLLSEAASDVTTAETLAGEGFPAVLALPLVSVVLAADAAAAAVAPPETLHGKPPLPIPVGFRATFWTTYGSCDRTLCSLPCCSPAA